MDRRAPRTGADVASPHVVQEQGTPISIAVFDSALIHYLFVLLFVPLSHQRHRHSCLPDARRLPTMFDRLTMVLPTDKEEPSAVDSVLDRISMWGNSKPKWEPDGPCFLLGLPHEVLERILLFADNSSILNAIQVRPSASSGPAIADPRPAARSKPSPSPRRCSTV